MEKKDNVKGIRRHFITEAGFNVSWSSIIAGVVTFFAILAVLSLIGSAIGFGVVEPTANKNKRSIKRYRNRRITT